MRLEAGEETIIATTLHKPEHISNTYFEMAYWNEVDLESWQV